MKKSIYVTGLLLSSFVFAGTKGVNLEGTYNCSGTEVGSKSPYTCSVTIKRTGETLLSQASCSDGNSYKGTAIYDDKHKHFSTAFINPKNTKETGVSISYVKRDGSLKTVWTYLNETSTSIAHCKRLKG